MRAKAFWMNRINRMITKNISRGWKSLTNLGLGDQNHNLLILHWSGYSRMKISIFYDGKLGLIPKTDDVAKWTCGIKTPWSFLPLLSTRVPQKVPQFEGISKVSTPFALRLTIQRRPPKTQYNWAPRTISDKARALPVL